MAQVDLVYFLQPLLLILATGLLLVYYYRRGLLTNGVLGYSLLAYFFAITAKLVVQIAVPIPSNPFAAGAYYGLQTSFLEVGLAYLFATRALVQHRMRIENAPAYGAGLAFWENGVLLGILTLPGLAITIAGGGDGLPTGSLGEVLSLVGLGTLERVSSVLAHVAWGTLVVVAAATGRRRYLLAALPMGLIDFLVAFAPSMTLAEFEGIVFALSVLCLLVAYLLTREEGSVFWSAAATATPGIAYTYAPPPVPMAAPAVARAPAPPADLRERARCGKCGAVFAAEWNVFLPHLGPLVLRKCPACGRRSFMGSTFDAAITWPPPDQRLR